MSIQHPSFHFLSRKLAWSSALLVSMGLLTGSVFAQSAPQLPSSATMIPPTISNQQNSNGQNGLNVTPFVAPNVTQTPSATMQGQAQSSQTQKEAPSPTQADKNAVSASLSKKSATPTAAEQGLEDPRQQALATWQLRQTINNESARQRGEQIPFPSPADPVGKSVKYRGWLANWEKALTDTGVGLEKIRFEEARLNQEDFSRWASNQLRFEPNSISVQPLDESSEP